MSHESGALTDAIAPRSPFYQGPYGRIFRDLDAWRPDGIADADLETYCLAVANTRMLERPGATPPPRFRDIGNVLRGQGRVNRPARSLVESLRKGRDAGPGAPVTPAAVDESVTATEFGSTIPAGYTYFGQFVDHDMTFDPQSSLEQQNDPNHLVNFRTPRLDLDCVYGRGPHDQPYLYEGPGSPLPGAFVVGTVDGTSLRDLQRNAHGRALIGDMRNDENAMVSQLQLAFLLAHNTLLQRAVDAGRADPFRSAQRSLRWLYQWVLWHDFLARILDPDVHAEALHLDPRPGGFTRWVRGYKDVYSWSNSPFMPVEFSVAAYRFGHSMVRNGYQTNFPHRGVGSFAPIFDNSPGTTGDDLRGFRQMVPENVIQWDWFLPMSSPAGFPQMARSIDTRLANALAFLHEGATGSPMNVLASRNLLRGIRFDLPSGPDVAAALGVGAIDLEPDEPAALWYYVLKEAETLPAPDSGNRLGPVGSLIVAAVFTGLLQGDPRSWLNVSPLWTPDQDPLLRPGADNVDGLGTGTTPQETWQLSSIIRLAGLPVAGGDF